MTVQRGRRYYYQVKRVPDRAMLLMSLPISEMTLQELSDHVGLRPGTVSDYLKLLRREGLITAFFKHKNSCAEGRAAIRVRNIEANQTAIAAVNAEFADTRETLCPATWAVYAAVLTPEQMMANFKKRG